MPKKPNNRRQGDGFLVAVSLSLQNCGRWTSKVEVNYEASKK